MCRNIKPLFNFEPPASDDELHEAAVQFVRKVSGFTRPARDNTPAFDVAVEEIEASLHRLLHGLHAHNAPKSREVEAEKARARRARFA